MQSLIRSTFGGALRSSCNSYARVTPPSSLFKVSQPYSTIQFKASRLPNFSNAKPFSGSSPLRLGAWVGAGTVAAVGLHMSLMPKVRLERPRVAPAPPTTAAPPVAASSSEPLPPPPTSALNVYELSFGTVCGICAGVFVKKGAKAVAFFLGGVFILLQYFTSVNVLNVKWASVSSRFEETFYSTPAPGEAPRPPTVMSLWNWLVDFLAADFPPRATFLAGFVLGLRLG
ncbi:hypothetical protein FRB96_003094 [Tulasnella sp. 330]|nr:hypothetical protein FRB96_003094 [Tulasnella sp. 330]